MSWVIQIKHYTGERTDSSSSEIFEEGIWKGPCKAHFMWIDEDVWACMKVINKCTKESSWTKEEKMTRGWQVTEHVSHSYNFLWIT